MASCKTRELPLHNAPSNARGTPGALHEVLLGRLGSGSWAQAGNRCYGERQQPYVLQFHPPSALGISWYQIPNRHVVSRGQKMPRKGGNDCLSFGSEGSHQVDSRRMPDLIAVEVDSV